MAQIFKATPASPILETAQQKLFRTRIQEGVRSGGELVREGKVQPGPNFAGHYVVEEWACGSPGLMMAVVDALTGKVYNPPMSVDLIPTLVVGHGPLRSRSWSLNQIWQRVPSSPTTSSGKTTNGPFFAKFLWSQRRIDPSCVRDTPRIFCLLRGRSETHIRWAGRRQNPIVCPTASDRNETPGARLGPAPGRLAIGRRLTTCPTF